MSTREAVEAERNRRERMWKGVEEIQAQRPLKSDEVRELGCYGSARGIWRDTKETKHLTPSECGVALGISSRGKYEDEFTDETALYRYPLTQQRGQDEGDIRSLRWALEFNLPLFLIRSANAKGELTHSGKFRKVDKVFILRDLPDPDGVDGEVLLTFSQGGRRDYSLTPEEGGSFEERQTALWTTRSKKRSQELSVRRVKDRYGPKCCAVCGALPVVVQAAHIRPVAEDGSDWDGNGIWLCQNHHSLFDAGIWSIRPGDLAVVPAAGYDLSSLLMEKSDLKHLSAAPFPDALEWRWEWFQKRTNAETSVA